MTTSPSVPPRRIDRTGALARLVRPLNVAMMLLGALVGGVLVRGADAFAGASASALLLATLAAAAIGAGANAINDRFDLAIDRRNRPDRPLPSGLVSERAALVVWASTSLLGIGLAAFVSAVHFSIAALSVGLLYAYSARLKREPLAGNVAVAVVIGLVLPFGGLAVWQAEGGPLGALLVGALFAAGTTLAREVAKDVEDRAGDAAEGARTLAVRWGPRAGGIGVCLAVLAVLPLFPLGAALGLGAPFLVAALPAAALVLAAAWTALGFDASDPPEVAGRASALLKGAMFAGLIALTASAW